MSTLLTGLLLTAATASAAEAPRDTTRLPELVVAQPAKVNVELVPLTVDIVTSAQIDRSTETSLLPILDHQVPGLFVTRRGLAGYGVSDGAAGTVNIRGIGGGNKVLFMVDGQPQWAGVFGHSVADTYTTGGVERVEVVKGPSSFLYGSNAMAGSINVITKRPTEDGFHGRARALFGSYSTQRFNAAADMKLGDFTAAAMGNLERSNGNRAGSAYWLADERLQFGWQPSEHWSAGADVNLTQSHADNPGTTQSPLESMWTSISRGLASVHVKDNYGFARGGAQAFISWGRHKVDDGYAPGAEPKTYLFNSTDYNMGFTLYQTFNPWTDNDLSAGVDFLHWGGHNWNTDKADPSVRSSEARHHENEIGAYVMMQQGFVHDLLSLNAGIRYQHGSQYGDQWIPQAGLIVRPWKEGQFKFNYSKGYRAPNIRELYLYVPANPDLKPEYMHNYEVELRQRFLDNSLDLGLALYFIDAKNLIQTLMVDGRMKNVNTGRLINKGFEVDATYHISRQWMAYANYAYLHTSSPVVSAPKNKLDAAVTFSPGRFDFTLESNNVWALYTSSSTKTSYSLLNFHAAYQLPAKADLRVMLDLENLTNHHYEILLGCPMPGFTIMGGVEMRF